MSQEISGSFQLSASKGGVSISSGASAVIDMTGAKMLRNVQIIGTASEAVNVGDIPTGGGVLGALALRNMDPDNYIEIAIDSGMANILARLKPNGLPLLLPCAPGVTYHARANTAACNLDVTAIEA